MNNLPTKFYKKRALELMRDTKPSPLLAGLFYFIIVGVITALTPILSGSEGFAGVLRELQAAGRYDVSLADIGALYQQHVHPGGMILSFALNLCLITISVGFSWYCLNVARGENPSVSSIFDGFGSFFKIIWLQIVTGFFIFLWSLLLVVPGIIAAIRYSQAIFIMRDHPEYGALDCIRASKEMMRGNKGDFFGLQLSFIGWFFLSVLIMTVIQIVSQPGTLISTSLVSTFGSILNIWLNPYMEITMALFYVNLTGGGYYSGVYRD